MSERERGRWYSGRAVVTKTNRERGTEKRAAGNEWSERQERAKLVLTATGHRKAVAEAVSLSLSGGTREAGAKEKGKKESEERV